MKLRYLFLTAIALQIGMMQFCFSDNQHSYYISPKGSDYNIGNQSGPYETFNKSLSQLKPGDTLVVKAGTYAENIIIDDVHGSPEKPIVLEAESANSVVLDGNQLELGRSNESMILIRNSSNIVINGFEIKNLRTQSSSITPSGITITGNSHSIELVNNKINHIENNNQNGHGNAHGIAVYGLNHETPVYNIKVINNEISQCKLGNSESLALNGNVTDFIVENNYIHHNDNIGIDFIGYEGTSSSKDFARRGLCSNNHICYIDSRNNPAYHGDGSAAGIYSDGASDILITRNKVHNCNVGIEVASESEDGITSNIQVVNNFIYNNMREGIGIGGYDYNKGSAQNCYIANNTLYKNASSDKTFGEISIAYHCSSNKVLNNVIIANSGNKFITNYTEDGLSNHISNNLYVSYKQRSDVFVYNNNEYAQLNDYRKNTGLDNASVHLETSELPTPDFVFLNPGAYNFYTSYTLPQILINDLPITPPQLPTDIIGASEDMIEFEHKNIK